MLKNMKQAALPNFQPSSGGQQFLAEQATWTETMFIWLIPRLLYAGCAPVLLFDFVDNSIWSYRVFEKTVCVLSQNLALVIRKILLAICRTDGA